ncbi:DUF7935 family protein [Gynurincola endophyticus]|jgi:uncharacterized protein (UPF0333 family)|uniref:DUF7935 family protein n=1 Tax=Gynurincola endophyticus TaxID=2479004 RepID=UPI000F8DBA0B|nr:hypothetical protein [Gynurincola endophyticus]
MYDEYLLPAVLVALLIAGAYMFFLMRKNKQEIKETLDQHKKTVDSENPARQLQLQSYERLILLADRISLPNIITRVGSNVTGTAREMQILLTQTIKQEFEYNVTQQIYVSKEAWDAVTNLKDQNILIINQVASFLPEGAQCQDLNRAILEMLVEHPKASLHTIVMEVLSYEAKKLL